MATGALNRGAGDVLINGITIRTTSASDDSLSTSFGGSAIAKAAAINDASKLTRVTARVIASEDSDNADIAGGTLDNKSFIETMALS